MRSLLVVLVNHDKHIGVEFISEPIPDRKPDGSRSPAEIERRHGRVTFWNAGYVKAERLDGNVGYLRIDSLLLPSA